MIMARGTVFFTGTLQKPPCEMVFAMKHHLSYIKAADYARTTLPSPPLPQLLCPICYCYHVCRFYRHEKQKTQISRQLWPVRHFHLHRRLLSDINSTFWIEFHVRSRKNHRGAPSAEKTSRSFVRPLDTP